MEEAKKAYDSKEKIRDKYILKKICEYVNRIGVIEIKTLNIGKYLIFDYFNIVPELLHAHFIRPETIFKINILHICNQIKKCPALKNMFLNVRTQVEFEKSSMTCKKYRRRTYIHDVSVEISNNNSTYEIGFEYNEEGHSTKVEQDNMKNIYSIMCLDSYNVFCEKDKNYEKFMNNIIFEMLVYVCSLTNAKFELAKILYFKDKEIVFKNELEDIEQIFDFMKNNHVSINFLWNTFVPFYTNLDGDIVEYQYQEYKTHLIDDLDIDIFEEYCDFKNFLDIMCKDLNQNNETMTLWNRFLIHAMNKLNEASDEIIKLNNKMNIKKDLMHPFVEDIIKNLHRYPNDSIVMIGINNFLREHGYTGQISEIEIFNIFDIQNINNNTIDNEIKEEIQKETNETQIKNIVSDNKENINKIIKKYYRTTNKQHIEENVRLQLVTFFNLFFSMDKNNRYVDINKKKEIQQIFRDWSKKYYHTSGDRTIVFSLLKKILLL